MNCRPVDGKIQEKEFPQLVWGNLSYRDMVEMKLKHLKFIILTLIAIVFMSGCNRNSMEEKAFSVQESVFAENSVGPSTVGEDSVAPQLNAANQEDIIKIALIDTGITASAINQEHLLAGWNYCRDSDITEDTIGHGTSLAGMILGSEKAGIAGLASEAYVVPLVCQEMEHDGTIHKADPQLLAQIIMDAISIYGCQIISISAGVKQDYPVLKEAVAFAEEKGVIIVSGAGNEGNQDIYYPGGYEYVLCVGSVNKEMTGRAEFSQNHDMVDILAPGEDIVVTTMKGNSMTVSGTSYSVAYVSAAVAQIWQQNPGKTSHQIIELLMDHWGRCFPAFCLSPVDHLKLDK